MYSFLLYSLVSPLLLSGCLNILSALSFSFFFRCPFCCIITSTYLPSPKPSRAETNGDDSKSLTHSRDNILGSHTIHFTAVSIVGSTQQNRQVGYFLSSLCPSTFTSSIMAAPSCKETCGWLRRRLSSIRGVAAKQARARQLGIG